MRIKPILILCLLICLSVSSCSSSDNTKSSNDPKSENSKVEKEEKALSGNELIESVFVDLKSQVATVKHSRILDEDSDGNNLIGKQGQYQYAGSFYDTRTGYEPTNDDFEPIDISEDPYGASAGGTIEIFSTENDAKKRADYLSEFQTGLIQAGAYRVVGNVVLRASEEYKASEQTEVLDLMESILLSNK